MPMTWNAEADAKLMAKIIQVCDVKINGAQMSEIAAAMGSDCTPKALTHRLTHFRKMGGASKATNGDKPAKVTKTTAAKRGGKKAKAETTMAARTPSPGGDDEELPTPPATARGKRKGTKRNDEEESDGEGQVDGLNDKIKIEVGEDIGEGLRQGADDEAL